ncbi:MAG: hypothetical protein KAW56_09600, partial [Candidatus Marinimicrobia bacterium]|nr:hypothetical protein [Candidatus Neomarinimicrobiota bacterium]
IEWTGDFDDLLKKNTNVKIESRKDDREKNSAFEIHLRVGIIDGLHLSAGSSGIPIKGMPDIQQVQRQKIDYDNGNAKFVSEYVDYGTAIKGRFRTAMEMLLRTYLHRNEIPKDNITKIVPADPSEYNDKYVSDDLKKFFGGKKYKGAWSVREKVWTNPHLSREDHIKIDEFTQQTIEHAKFDFAPLSQGKTDVFILLNPGHNESWQKTLLYLTAELLALNLLPWGGHGSRGYLGATITFENCEDIKEKTDLNKFKSFIEQLDKTQKEEVADE